MKKTLLMILITFWLSDRTAFAQVKTDRIYRIDKTIIEGKIEEISETEILYKISGNAKAPVKHIARKDVRRIVYANGKVEELTLPAASKVTSNKQKQKDGVKTTETSKSAASKEIPVVEVKKEEEKVAEITKPAAPKVMSDRIIRKDGGIVEGKIVNASPGKIEYKNPDDKEETIYFISGADVAKIEYADGRIVDMTASVKPPSAKKEKNKDKPKSDPVVKKQNRKKITFDQEIAGQSGKGKPRQLLDIPRFVIGVGAEASYVLEPLSKKWVSTSDSIGLQQGFGGSLRADLHVTKGIALSLGAGYNVWQVKRNYVTTDITTNTKVVQYATQDKFQVIPIQAGIKLYLMKGFYLMPEASFNIITASSSYKDGIVVNPNGNKTSSTSVSKIGYGGSIGCEIYKLPTVIDISVRFQVINAEQFRSLNEPLYYAGLRLGIGIGK